MKNLAKHKPGTPNLVRVPGSFRDPAGYVYREGSHVFRYVSEVGLADFKAAEASGLYKALTKEGLLVSHKLVEQAADFAIIKPELVPYISYPFEWSFGMLRDAALATLRSQKIALEMNMSLKDATAYNVQFMQGKPILIDTLSFEPYEAGKPWVAYGQFCRHFLAPLALMAYSDMRLQQLLREHIDGIPLDLTAKLLPRTKRFKPSLFMHLVMHASAQNSNARTHRAVSVKVPKSRTLAIIDHLERAIKSINYTPPKTEWGDYYNNTNYSESARDDKAKTIESLTKNLKLKKVVDMGGNNGQYSRIFSRKGVATVCADIDPVAVEANYRMSRQNHDDSMLPLLVDVINPGGAIGWANREREPVHVRLQCDLVMALALVHHLAISNNLPFQSIAEYFSSFAPYLVIEFVPKIDSQVQKLLATRKDVFPEYDQAHFEAAFESTYTIVAQKRVKDSKRTLYVMRRRG